MNEDCWAHGDTVKLVGFNNESKQYRTGFVNIDIPLSTGASIILRSRCAFVDDLAVDILLGSPVKKMIATRFNSDMFSQDLTTGDIPLSVLGASLVPVTSLPARGPVVVAMVTPEGAAGLEGAEMDVNDDGTATAAPDELVADPAFAAPAGNVLQAVSGLAATAAATPGRKLTSRRMWEALAKGAASPEAAEVLRLDLDRLKEGLDRYLAPRFVRLRLCLFGVCLWEEASLGSVCVLVSCFFFLARPV
jgi:hypothetical protein